MKVSFEKPVTFAIRGVRFENVSDADLSAEQWKDFEPHMDRFGGSASPVSNIPKPAKPAEKAKDAPPK